MKVKISMRQVLAVAVLLNLLVMLQSIPVIANPVSPIVYLDDLPSQATYTVKTDGTNYWAIRYDGYKAYDSTNASYVINSAIASANTLGRGTVFLQSGSYWLTHDIQMRNNTALVGESWDKTILINNRATATGYTSGLIKNQNINESVKQAEARWNKDYNITIKSLQLWGKRAAGKAGFGIAIVHADNILIDTVKLQDFAADTINFNGLSYNQGGRGQGNGTSYNVVLRNIYIENAGIDGIAFNHVYEFRIEGYTVKGFSQLGSGSNNGHAITMSAGSSHGTVTNVLARDSINVTIAGAHGVALNGAHDITFFNGWFYNISGDGFHAESIGSDNPMDLSVSNWHVINVTMNGYYFLNGYYETVSNVEALNSGYGSSNTYDNFRLYNTDRSTFTNLLMRDNQTPHSTKLGFNSYAGSDYNILSGLLVYGASNATGYTNGGVNSLTGTDTILNVP